MDYHCKKREQKFRISKTQRVHLTWIIKKIIAIFIITVRPLLGPAQCKFQVSCTRFALKTIEQENLVHAFFLIIKRLCYCSPFPFTKNPPKYLQ
ncbi:membrane protein insertion efficiency factor YidD [bacterium]|nr:MAG: membrane protein insertion efficiency factor YidD [bacterium]QQR61863.1 MAG: membrane protein insertion efficiency factor YidD [bacterium]